MVNPNAVGGIAMSVDAAYIDPLRLDSICRLRALKGETRDTRVLVEHHVDDQHCIHCSLHDLRFPALGLARADQANWLDERECAVPGSCARRNTDSVSIQSQGNGGTNIDERGTLRRDRPGSGGSSASR